MERQRLQPMEDAESMRGEERQAQGQGQGQGQDEIDQRAALLMQQAEAIMEAGGPDMLEVFRQDDVIRENVLSGAWDFQVSYGYLLGRESTQRSNRRTVPTAVRSPNHASTKKGIASMSDKEFNELDERLARGEIIDPGR